MHFYLFAMIRHLEVKFVIFLCYEYIGIPVGGRLTDGAGVPL